MGRADANRSGKFELKECRLCPLNQFIVEGESNTRVLIMVSLKD
jgi:hypothetical protein